ncbi:unnamed protein product [Caenorhabditis nigoni]
MEQTNYNKLPIRSNIQVDKRKTKLCRHFRKGGDQICHYGSKCIFIHPEDGELYQNLIADTEEYHQQKTMINEKIGKLYQKRKVSSNFKKKQEYAKTINKTIRQWNEDYPKAPNYYDLHGMTEQGAIDYVLDIVKWMRVKNVKTSRLETGKGNHSVNNIPAIKTALLSGLHIFNGCSFTPLPNNDGILELTVV